MKDRQPTKVLANGAIRYGIYNADGSLNHYEYMKREDAPTVEGTPLNKANLLSDATAAKIWPNAADRPEDPTVDGALAKLSQGTAKVGDIAITSRTDLSNAWLPCDGRYISGAQYPELFNILRSNKTDAAWDVSTLMNAKLYYPSISYANGYWFITSEESNRLDDGMSYYDDGKIYYSSDLVSWNDISIPKNPLEGKKYQGLTITTSRIRKQTTVQYLNGEYVLVFFMVFSTNPGGSDNYLYVCAHTDTLDPVSWKLTVLSETGHYLQGASSVPVWLFYDGSKYIASFADEDEKKYGCLYRAALIEEPEAITLDGWAFSQYGENRLPTKYNAETGYFYRTYFNYSEGKEQLQRTQYPLDQSSWTTVFSHPDFNVSQYAVDGNTISIITVSSDSTSGSKKYAYFKSENNGATFTQVIANATISGLTNTDYLTGGMILADGVSVCVVESSSLSDTTPKLLLADDDASGFVCITMPHAFNGSGRTYQQAAACGSLAAIITSAAGNGYVMYHDFAYGDKKIPTVTPGLRSQAYIKALEE